MMSLRVLTGAGGTGDTYHVIQAILYAEKNGADICNLSMGSYQDDSLLRRTILNSKMLFVCAAGNDRRNLDRTPIYPGSYHMNNVICVGNMQKDGALYWPVSYTHLTLGILSRNRKVFAEAWQGT